MINAPAAITARKAVCRRCSFDSDAVQAMKIGATPTGSMITVNVTNVVPMIVQSTARRLRARAVRSVAVEREVHVVLRAAGPAAAPTPPDRGEGLAHLSRDHAAAMARAV